MSSVAVHNNLDTLIDALVADDQQALLAAVRSSLQRTEDASELLGRVGLLAMHSDSEGHTVLTLAAAAALSRWLIALRHVLGEDEQGQSTGLPLVLQALRAAAPAVKAAQGVTPSYPTGLFPSEIGANETVSERLEKAIYGRDVETTERVLFGLFGTGADYRTLSLNIYEAISQTYQEEGHSLLQAVRGAQVLDAVEWGEDMPGYIHWLAPHLPLHTEEPSWIQIVRSFLREPQHKLDSYRTRLAAPKDENALPLRALLLSDASTSQVAQGVYDALITNGASARGIGSVIALTAADILQQVGDDQQLFERAAHGLLFASATRLIFTQIQAVVVLPLLFTAAAAINALHKDLGSPVNAAKPATRGSAGGGLIAPALLESLLAQIGSQDLNGALASSHRYLQLGHDPAALFSVIGLGAAQIDAAADQGHALQTILAAGDEYLAWPKALRSSNIESFLEVALRAPILFFTMGWGARSARKQRGMLHASQTPYQFSYFCVAGQILFVITIAINIRSNRKK